MRERERRGGRGREGGREREREREREYTSIVKITTKNSIHMHIHNRSSFCDLTSNKLTHVSISHCTCIMYMYGDRLASHLMVHMSRYTLDEAPRYSIAVKGKPVKRP